MRFFASIAFAAFTGLASLAHAQERVVLVELFTSQGCNSCPPADEYVGELAERGNVLALSLHVDYWDYLGWRDPYAKAAFTDRQKQYAYEHGERSVFTPQMIIGGSEAAIGHDKRAIEAAIARQTNQPMLVAIETRRSGDTLSITLRPTGQALSGTVHVVRFAPSKTQQISRGENRGRTITYTNVVVDWTAMAVWSGGVEEFMMPLPEDDLDTAVIVQEGQIGPVLAAAVVQ